jgi:peroxiredoxin
MNLTEEGTIIDNKIKTMSHSKKRHILESNIKIEKRYLKESKNLITEAIVVGSPAPELSLTNLRNDKETISLSSYIGKPVIYEFFQYYCGPCAQRMKQIAENNTNNYTVILATEIDEDENNASIKEQKSYSLEKVNKFLPNAIVVYGLNSDKPSKPGGLGFNHWGGTPPRTAVIDSNGVVTFFEVGSEDVEGLKNAINTVK